MKRPVTSSIIALAALLSAASDTRAAAIVNPSFEDPITFDGAPFVGFWEGFTSGPGAAVANVLDGPLSPARTGPQSAEISIVNTDNAFAGVFQDIPIPDLSPGTEISFSGWHQTLTEPFEVGVEIRFEWVNNLGVKFGQTGNLVLVPDELYRQFNFTSEVPSGAAFARVVYAIQSFGNEPSNTGVVHLDDLEFVPEPMSVSTLAFGSLLLSCFRRRRNA